MINIHWTKIYVQFYFRGITLSGQFSKFRSFAHATLYLLPALGGHPY